MPNDDFSEQMGNFVTGLIIHSIIGTVKGAFWVARYAGGRRVTECAGGCGSMLEYNLHQNGSGPFYCEACAERRVLKAMAEREISDLNYVMPGMGQSIGQMGGYRGKHYGRKIGGRWILHCVVFFRDDTHTSWDCDLQTEQVSNLHARPDDLNEMR